MYIISYLLKILRETHLQSWRYCMQFIPQTVKFFTLNIKYKMYYIPKMFENITYKEK